MDVDSEKRFAVALSFPGEHRSIVEQVARQLAAAFDQKRVLYDKYHDAEFARPDLDTYLPALYREDAELIVIFLCPEYPTKRFCRLEWRHIRQLIATLDAKRIMFLSLGDAGDLSDLGILPGDGYIDIHDFTPQDVAKKIVERFRLNQGSTTPKCLTIPVLGGATRVDISRIIKYAPADLIGREADTKLLDDAWHKVRCAESPRPHVFTFVGLGGEGKTSVVAKWAAGLAGQDWPGCDAVFAWSFYSQGTRQQAAASSDLFLREALVFFGDASMANSDEAAYDKGRRLAQLAGEQRGLLILDGVEPLQYPPTSPTRGALKDQGLAALFTGLAVRSHALCIITTRYSIPNLRAFWQSTAPEVKLERLSREAGVHLLQSLGVKGSLRSTISLNNSTQPVNEFEVLVDEVKGHALTLNLLGTYLRDAHGGDIRKRKLVRLSDADMEEEGGHAFRVMDAYVHSFLGEGERGQRTLALLSLLGLFDRPATSDCLEALWTTHVIDDLTGPLVGLSDAERNLALKRLEDAKLLTVNRDASNQLLSLDSHPLIREYFAAYLRSKHPSAWHAGHRRLYDHLCARTREGDQPTLEALEPLYQAVAHGCEAGLQQDAFKVYVYRILRGVDAYYSMRKLGSLGTDLGALACFFESFQSPWSRVSPAFEPPTQSWILHQAAFCLRALGRLTEALDPMQVSGEMDVKLQQWEGAARSFINISELELRLGSVVEALEHAEQSVTYAGLSGDAFLRIVSRATHANALHQAGRRIEAEKRFRRAEQMEVGLGNLPYSLRRFQYCDLLLSSAERAAWAMSRKVEPRMMKGNLIKTCSAVGRRAAQTLKLVTGQPSQPSLLDEHLEHLTLARATLCEALLSSRSSSLLSLAAYHASEAMAGLRLAGQQEYIADGLLTRAWCSFAQSSEDRTHGHNKEAADCLNRSQADLDEAWEIAARGPMPLLMADTHLYRARLFGMRKTEGEPYPWESPADDLAAARILIEKHGYRRRKEELEDAEAALSRPTRS